jgi:hypothetical protein
MQLGVSDKDGFSKMGIMIFLEVDLFIFLVGQLLFGVLSLWDQDNLCRNKILRKKRKTKPAYFKTIK